MVFEDNNLENIQKEQNNEIVLLVNNLDAISRVTKQNLFVIDFINNKMIYCSKNLEFINEASQKDFKREEINPYWSLIIEEDYGFLLDVREALMKLSDALTEEQRLKHSIVTDYRISLNNKPYMVMQKSTVIKFRPDGKIWLVLFCIAPSFHSTKPSSLCLGEDFCYMYNDQTKSFLQITKAKVLTEIEKNILHRMSKGCTSEQIAEDLNLSENTIKTHRRRMFRKLRVNSLAEALNVVENYYLYI